MISDLRDHSTFNGGEGGGLKWWFPCAQAHLMLCLLMVSETPLSNPLTAYPPPPESYRITSWYRSSHYTSFILLSNPCLPRVSLPPLTTLHLSSTTRYHPLLSIQPSYHHVTSTHLHLIHICSYHPLLDAWLHVSFHDHWADNISSKSFWK
jgi:hypothetical protein